MKIPPMSVTWFGVMGVRKSRFTIGRDNLLQSISIDLFKLTSAFWAISFFFIQWFCGFIKEHPLAFEYVFLRKNHPILSLHAKPSEDKHLYPVQETQSLAEHDNPILIEPIRQPLLVSRSSTVNYPSVIHFCLCYMGLDEFSDLATASWIRDRELSRFQVSLEYLMVFCHQQKIIIHNGLNTSQFLRSSTTTK